MKNFHTLLVERGVATMRQVEEAMARQVLYGGDLASHVLEQIGQDHEGALNLALAAHYHLDPADAGPLPLASAQAMQVVPRDLALRHAFYPLRLEARALILVVSSPLPEEVEGDLFFHLSVPTKQLITSRIRVRQALSRDGVAPLDNREQRSLARIEGRPVPGSGSVPPPGPPPGAPPSVRAMTLRLPAVRPIEATPPPAPVTPTTSSDPSVAPVSPVSPVAASVAVPAIGEARNPAWPQATKGLLRWMQRASKTGAPVRSRRRRGPMPLGECEDGLHHAATGEEALQIFFDFAQQYFSYSALFVVQGDLAEGRDAFGAGADPERVAGIGIPLDLPSCLAQARNLGAPVSVLLRPDGIDASLASDLKRSPRKAIFVLPIAVRQRCVALLYGDNGEDAVELADAAEVISAGSLAGGALERLAMARKRKRNTETGTPPPPTVARKTTIAGMPAVSAFSEATSQASQHRHHKSNALARALGLPSDLPRAAVPPPTMASPRVSAPEDSNPFRRLTASFQAVQQPPRASDEAIPATVAAVPHPRPSPAAVPHARPTPAVPQWPGAPPGVSAGFDSGAAETPEVQVGEASAEDDELVRSALREMFEASPAPPRPEPVHPRSERSSYHPPSSPPSEHKLAALPSIIVDLDEEQTRLLDRLVASTEGGDEVLSEILQEGVRMVPALLSRQPGPLRVPREELSSGALRPSQAGPLLRALVALRKTALPFLIVQSGSAAVEARLLATLLLGELPYPEVAYSLIPRLLDAEPSVARAALASARWLRSSPEVFTLLLRELNGILSDTDSNAERKAKAQRALDQLAE